ncbi:hypothetical protein Q5P01_000570 [Channa striata]|uniref:Uncharacterized protein n=1 Tax=Channa striata TaxID=64152 RepID=A0AA88LFT5_CHASR|nr:hypothetical protein Q5P01_000570 [Channa striata]
MQRGRAGIAGGFDSLISTGKELFGSKLSAGRLHPERPLQGKAGRAIAVITSLIVGFHHAQQHPVLHRQQARHQGYGRFFAATSKRKMDDSGGEEPSKSTRTVFACLIVMNVELFMSVVAGCMELLYRPLIQDEHRLHNMECAIAVFNIVIYAMYVVTMVLTSTVLKEKQDEVRAGSRKDATEIAIAPNSSRQPLLLQQQGQWESLLFAIQRFM